MKRDFSDEALNKMLGLVDQVESEKWGDFTDWIGDRWYDFETWNGSLGISNYVNNVNAYHKKVIDKNNTSKQSIESIFTAVRNVDASYGQTFADIHTNLSKWRDYIEQLSQIVEPGKGRFNAEYMSGALSGLLTDISKCNIERVKDNLVQDIGGELIFNEDLLYEYIQKNPTEMTDDEMAAVLEVIQQLEGTVAFYESAASVRTDEIDANFLNRVLWVAEDERYSSFAAVSAHYNDIYVRVLDSFAKCDEDSYTFGSAVVKATQGDSELVLSGTEGSIDLNKYFGGMSLAAYAMKWKTKHTEHYFYKLEESVESGLKFGSGMKDIEDYIYRGDKDHKNVMKGIEEWLKSQGNPKKKEKTWFEDEDGNLVKDDDAPNFYDSDFTLGEIDVTIGDEASLYEGSYELLEDGKLDVVVGKAEAHSSISGGFYVVNSDGKRLFSPGVKAEIGTSITGFDVKWEHQAVGDENLGINYDVGVTALKAEAKADVGAQLFNEDGKLDMQFGASASAEAILAEAEGSVGANVLGGEIAASAGVNFGVGAHADVGFRDGVFKCDVGASLGVGVSFDVEIDVGGMVDTVYGAASSAWDDLKEGWNNLFD